MTSIYLERYAWQQELFPGFEPSKNLGSIIVLPAFKEPDIEVALEALNNCTPPSEDVLILIVVNEPQGTNEQIRQANLESINSIKSHRNKFQILTTYLKLPKKKAGVGLARKIGMDEAVRIFRKIDHDGVIICYDADCWCDDNYLVEIQKAYEDPHTKSAIVFYEHQLNRSNHDHILRYELYLRYYINGLRFAGFPYAHQTLGSCITVRCSHYEKVGGMNTRQAGEDFYFLNKTIPHGGFLEVNSTTVRPSDRVSDRVPFGTGKAISDILSDHEPYSVYHPNSFEDLKVFFDKLDDFWESGDKEWQIPKTLESFLGEEWKAEILAVKKQVSSKTQFQKRFFHWFDAFKILKYIHHNRIHFYQDVELEEALEWLRSYTLHIKGDLESQLIQLRYHDRKNSPTK